MATRASLYLKGSLENEIEVRQRKYKQQAGDGGDGSVAAVITGELDVLFKAYKRSRYRIAERLTYPELRCLYFGFYCSIGGNGPDDDEDDYGLEYAVEEALFFMDGMINAGEDEDDLINSDWLGKVERGALIEKIQTLHAFDLLAVVDALEQCRAAYDAADYPDETNRINKVKERMKQLFRFYRV